MRNKYLIIPIILSPIWYVVIVISIATNYLNKATDHYNMGTSKYLNGLSNEGAAEKKIGDSFKSRANNTLLWLPKLVRPKAAD